jgi:hypothetical protein
VVNLDSTATAEAVRKQMRMDLELIHYIDMGCIVHCWQYVMDQLIKSLLLIATVGGLVEPCYKLTMES